MKNWILIALLSSLSLISCDPKSIDAVLSEILEGGNGISNQDISSGLKEALTKGVTNGTGLLSRIDGYYKSPYKILLPADAQKVVDKLHVIPGFSNVEQEINKKINRAAEDAAKKAKPIFVNAIKQMSFSDVMGILKGNNNAATSYLKSSTFNKLYSEFNPVIVNSLNKYGALNYWDQSVTAYNKIPFVTKMNPKLDDHITKKALDGLFKMVAKEELDIRTNLRSRTTDLLKKVFALQD